MLPLINIGYTSEEYKMNRPNFLLSLSERMNPYVFDLPSRAGHSELLDSIVKCVSAALRWHSSSSTEPNGRALPATLLQLYGNGVRMLRQALDDPLRSRDAEVLCATQLLCVFEVSDSMIFGRIFDSYMRVSSSSLVTSNQRRFTMHWAQRSSSSIAAPKASPRILTKRCW